MKQENWFDTFHKWLRPICRFGTIGHYTQFKSFRSASGEIEKLRATIYTDSHAYGITVSPTYLGCGATCRKSRTGEGWARGNDLSDGKFCRATWDAILRDIVSYELVELEVRPSSNEASEDVAVKTVPILPPA